MKIYIIKLNKRNFIDLVRDKKTTGYSIISKSFLIFLKETKSKRIKRQTIEHELSHIFDFKINLKNKINKSEFKKVLIDKSFREYNKKLYNTSFKIREEYLADLISYSIFGTKYEKKHIKTNYPKSFKIINKEFRKFKYQLIYI